MHTKFVNGINWSFENSKYCTQDVFMEYRLFFRSSENYTRAGFVYEIDPLEGIKYIKFIYGIDLFL